MTGSLRQAQAGRAAAPGTTASPAGQLARLMLAYGPRWHITTTIPGTGPRTLTATETGTGRRIQARSEDEMERKLAAISWRAPSAPRQAPVSDSARHLQ